MLISSYNEKTNISEEIMDNDDQYLDDIQRYQYETDNYYHSLSDISAYNLEQTARTDDLKKQKMNRRSLAMQRAERMKRIRGLLLRIILACTIFILLSFGKLCSVELFDYNTELVIEQVENNSWMETIQQKLKALFS